MNIRFRRGALACALLALAASSAWRSEDRAPETAGLESRETFRAGSRFFDEAAISGGVSLSRRDRRRYDGGKGRYETRLNHPTLRGNIDFASGFAGGVLGFDFGVFGAHDLMNKGAVDPEIGFEPWGDPPGLEQNVRRRRRVRIPLKAKPWNGTKGLHIRRPFV